MHQCIMPRWRLYYQDKGVMDEEIGTAVILNGK